jgi:hypothetical protein
MDPFRFRPVVTGLEDRLTPSVTPEEVFAAVDTARLSHVGLTEMLHRLGDPWGDAARQQFATHFAGLADLNRAAEQDLGEFLAALQARIATEPDVAPHLTPVTGGVGYALAMTQANAAYADQFSLMFGGTPRPVVPPPPASPPPAPFPSGNGAPFPDSNGTPTSPPGVPPAPFPPDVPPPPSPPTTTNVAPGIANVADQSVRSGASTAAIPFTVSDDQPAGALTVTPSSSDPSLIPLSGVVVTGTGADRAVTITPAVGRTGSAVVTLTVRDADGLTAADTFTITVSPPLATPASIPLNGSGLSQTIPDVNSPEWLTQASGLKIWDVTEGTGAAVQPGDTITIHYTGWLLNGTVFDSSGSRGTPNTFSLNGLIEGWKQGIPGMKEGGTRRLYIPSALAYGTEGQGSIPPNADLVFEIQLISKQ